MSLAFPYLHRIRLIGGALLVVLFLAASFSSAQAQPRPNETCEECMERARQECEELPPVSNNLNMPCGLCGETDCPDPGSGPSSYGPQCDLSFAGLSGYGNIPMIAQGHYQFISGDSYCIIEVNQQNGSGVREVCWPGSSATPDCTCNPNSEFWRPGANVCGLIIDSLNARVYSGPPYICPGDPPVQFTPWCPSYWNNFRGTYTSADQGAFWYTTSNGQIQFTWDTILGQDVLTDCTEVCRPRDCTIDPEGPPRLEDPPPVPAMPIDPRYRDMCVAGARLKLDQFDPKTGNSLGRDIELEDDGYYGEDGDE